LSVRLARGGTRSLSAPLTPLLFSDLAFVRAMDHRPLGPRPDKRHAAYQDIFGRQNGSQPPQQQQHLAGNYGGPSYAQYLPPGPSQQTYAYATPQMYTDRRISHDSAYPQAYSTPQYSHGPQPAVAAAAAYAQSYYASPAPSQAALPYYPAYAQSMYPQPNAYPQPQSHLGPPSSTATLTRGGSMASTHHTPGIISPRPEEPPDPQLEALMRSGLTPAQAYQYQVGYQNTGTSQAPSATAAASSSAVYPAQAPSPAHSGHPHRAPLPKQPHSPPSAYARNSGGYAHDSSISPPPHIGISIEPDDGRLGIDFESDSGSSPSGTDESAGQRRDRRSSASLQIFFSDTRFELTEMKLFYSTHSRS
jgi:RHO1 GDP-GTP exchange protein 1/2